MCSSAQQQWTTVLQRSWVQKSALFRWKMKVFILTNPYHEESFHPNKSLPRRKLFHNYGLFTGRECNVFDMRLLQIPKVTHVSVSAKLLVAKLYWGPLLIFEPKDTKYGAMEFSFWNNSTLTCKRCFFLLTPTPLYSGASHLHRVPKMAQHVILRRQIGIM